MPVALTVVNAKIIIGITVAIAAIAIIAPTEGTTPATNRLYKQAPLLKKQAVLVAFYHIYMIK